MPIERIRVKFSGYVQGVGFRFTTRMLASSFDVSGWVRNLPDGSVEMESQGESEELNRFIESLRREMNRHITDMKIVRVSPVPDEEDFTVRF